MNTTKNKSVYRSVYFKPLKRMTLLFLGALLFNQAFAQNVTENQTKSNHPFYLGVGTGFDSFTGLLGVSGTLNVYDKLSVRGGLGISGWGYKSSIGLKYDLKETGGWSYCLGYSYSPGFEGIKMDAESESGVKREITVDYLSASTINLAFDRNWKIGKANIFYLELGYAIPLQTNRWRTTDGSATSSDNDLTLKLLQPGGLILSVGFAFKTSK